MFPLIFNTRGQPISFLYCRVWPVMCIVEHSFVYLPNQSKNEEIIFHFSYNKYQVTLSGSQVLSQYFTFQVNIKII